MKKNFWELLVETYENDMKKLEEVYSLDSEECVEQMPICNDENAIMPYETPKVNWKVDGMIPIEWIKKYIAEEGIYPNRELLSVEQADAIERMIENWEKENETDRCR